MMCKIYRGEGGEVVVNIIQQQVPLIFFSESLERYLSNDVFKFRWSL